MKKQTLFAVIFVIISFLLVTWLPCQADDMYGCAKKKNGQLRIVSDPSKCLKSEYPITLYGTAPQNPIPNFQGELCWSIHITEDENGPLDATSLMRVGVTYMGGAYYSLQGFITVPNNNPQIYNGTAVIVGNEVFANLIFSWDDSLDLNRENSIAQIRLAISTLNGTLWSIADQFHTVTREFDHYYNAGTVTLTTCP